MSAATVRDKVAVKVLALASSTRRIHVYSNASTNTALAAWPPETLDDGLHAFVSRGATRRTGGTGTQRIERLIDVEWRFSALDRAEAERLMDALEDDVVTEFSAGITLGGSVIECVYLGADRPFEITDKGGREWVVWITHFRALERFATAMSA